jgi:hypothetical protein
MWRRCFVVLCVSILGVSFVGTAHAQDDEGTMTFGEEEAEEVQKGQEDDGSEEEGTMVFGDEAAEGQGPPLVSVLAVPTEPLQPRQRRQIESEMLQIARDVEGIEVESGDAVLDELEARTIETCVTEPLCLGEVGEAAGVDRILMARVTPSTTGSGLDLDIDYFDVSERLFIKYESAENLGSVSQVIDNVKPTLNVVFERRAPEAQQEFAEEDPGRALMWVGVGGSAAAAGAIAGGIVLALQAQQMEDDLQGSPRNGSGQYENLTQQEAKQRVSEIDSKFAAAGAFIGVGSAFAVGSAILIAVGTQNSESGPRRRAAADEDSQDATSSEERHGVSGWTLTPRFSRESAGLTAGFQF